MEQRIGPSSQPLKNEPVTGAGFDPAFIPGLPAPASPDPQDARPEAEETGETPASTAPAEEAAADVPADPADSVDAAEPEEPGEPTAAGGAPDGPVFEAADRRARIVADHRGVRLSLDDQECDFRWDEVGAVETATPRFGKRFTVTVHTPDRRWYPIEIEAPARSRFGEWETRLDAVLDAYFDDGTGAESGTEDRSGADGESEKDAGPGGDAGSGAAAEDTTISPA